MKAENENLNSGHRQAKPVPVEESPYYRPHHPTLLETLQTKAANGQLSVNTPSLAITTYSARDGNVNRSSFKRDSAFACSNQDSWKFHNNFQ